MLSSLYWLQNMLRIWYQKSDLWSRFMLIVVILHWIFLVKYISSINEHELQERGLMEYDAQSQKVTKSGGSRPDHYCWQKCQVYNRIQSTSRSLDIRVWLHQEGTLWKGNCQCQDHWRRVSTWTSYWSKDIKHIIAEMKNFNFHRCQGARSHGLYVVPIESQNCSDTAIRITLQLYTISFCFICSLVYIGLK